MRDIGPAERAVIGAILLDPAAVGDVADRLRPEHFAARDLAAVYRAMLDCFAAGTPATIPTLAAKLGADYQPMLEDLLAPVATAADIGHHARLVQDAARLRALAAEADRIAAAARQADVDELPRLLDGAAAAVATLADGARPGAAAPLTSALSAAFRQTERAAERGLPGISYGLRTLDQATGGLLPGALALVGGTTSSGKSALSLSVAAHAAEGGALVYVASLEMPAISLAHRLASMRSGVPLFRLVNGELDPAAWRRYADALGAARDLASRLHVDDRARLTVADIRSECRRLSRGGAAVGLVVADYVQLIRSERGSDGNREREVAAVARGLKAIALDFGCPVLACSQLNREADAGAPRLSHLRESGELEHAADVVLLIVQADDGTARIDVAKNRNGPKGALAVAWDARTTRFSDLATDEPAAARSRS